MTEHKAVNANEPKLTAKPEIDITPELDTNCANCLWGFIVKYCAVYVNLVKLTFCLTLQCSHLSLASKKQRHLDKSFHTFAHLKQSNCLSMAYNDTEPVFDWRCFQTCNLSKYYPDVLYKAVEIDAPGVQGQSDISLMYLECRDNR